MARRRTVTAVGGLTLIAILLIILRTRRGGASTDDVVTNVAVHVTRVEQATLHRYVTAYGYVEPAPAGYGRPAGGARLSPATPGIISEIDCADGQRVVGGTVLFRLDSRMAGLAVDKAKQEVGFAERTLERQTLLLRSNGTSQHTFQDAQQQLEAARSNLASAETALAYHEIRAPLTGTVARMNASLGQSVDANTTLAEIVNLDRLVVTADLPARDAAGVDLGRAAMVGSGNSPVRGTVTVLGKDLDPRTGAYRIQISVPAGSGLRPGQFVSARIEAEERKDVLVVPEVCVVSRTEEGSWVEAIEGGRAVRRPVSLGLKDGGRVEISGSGIAPGTTVVTDEAYGLPETTLVHVERR